MLGRNQGLGATAPQQRPLPMPQPQQRMVAPGTPMMRTPPMGRGMPRPMAMGGEVDIFGYEDESSVPRQTNIAGQPHMLSYINQDEEALLRSFGGSGIAGPGGIPSYPPSEYSAGQGSGYTTGTGSSNFDSGYISSAKKRRKKKQKQQQLAAQRAAAEQAIRDAEAAAAVAAQQTPSGKMDFGDEDYTPTSAALNQQLANQGLTNITTNFSPVNFGATSSGQDFTTAAQADTDVSGAEFVAAGGLGSVDSGSPASPPPVTLGSTEAVTTYTDMAGNTHSSAADRDRANLGIQQQMYGSGNQAARNVQQELYKQYAEQFPEGKRMEGDSEKLGQIAADEYLKFAPQINELLGPQGLPNQPFNIPFSFSGIEAITPRGSEDSPDDMTDKQLGYFAERYPEGFLNGRRLRENSGLDNMGLPSEQDIGLGPSGTGNQFDLPTGGPGTFGSTGLPPARTYDTAVPPGSGTTTSSPAPDFVTGISGGGSSKDPNQFPVEEIQSIFSPKAGTGGSDRSTDNRLTPEELENLKASLGEQVTISGVEKVFNKIIGGAFFGLGSGLADKLKASSEAERQAIVDQHLNALNSGATPVYNDKGEYVGFDISTMDTFADKVLAADDISVFLPGGSTDADGDGVIDSERFRQVFDAQSTAASEDPYGQSTEQGFITSDGREFFVDAGGNVVEVTDGTVPFEIGGGDNAIDIFSNTNTDITTTGGDDSSGPDLGHSVDEDGNIVCNTDGYIYNPDTEVCEPVKEEEKEEEKEEKGDGTPTINVMRGEDFDDVLKRVVTAAPNVGSISGSFQTMQEGGMAGLNRAADNFLQALAG